MIRRALTILGWGSAGAIVAAALISGAFAVAGTRLTEPAIPIRVSGPRLVADTTIANAVDGARKSPTPASPAPTTGGTNGTGGGTGGTGGGTGDRSTGPSTHASPTGSDDHGNDDGSGRGDGSGGGSGRGDD